MKVAIIKERRPYERRVAATPDSVKRTVEMGLQVTVESGAGAEAYFADDAYQSRRGDDRRRLCRPPCPMPTSF